MGIQEAFDSEKDILSNIIRRANEPVAEQFGLDIGNAPSHPSFCTPDWVGFGMDRGERYFISGVRGQAVGCVAYESPEPDLAYLNRLAVLPEFQGRGIGKQLVDHVIALAWEGGKKELGIGIIKAHAKLRDWYLSLGFELSGTKTFEHLPFDVNFMVFRF